MNNLRKYLELCLSGLKKLFVGLLVMSAVIAVFIIIIAIMYPGLVDYTLDAAGVWLEIVLVIVSLLAVFLVIGSVGTFILMPIGKDSKSARQKGVDLSKKPREHAQEGFVKRFRRYFWRGMIWGNLAVIAIIIVTIGIRYFTGVGLADLILFALDGMSDTIGLIIHLLSAVLPIIVIALVLFFLFRIRAQKKFWKKDPAERINILEKQFERGKFAKDDAIYYSNLSVSYYDNGDCEQGLNLALHAKSLLKEGKENALINNLVDANVAAYLVELGRLTEAAEILTRLDNIHGIHNANKLNVKCNLARLALMQGDIRLASAFADEASRLGKKIKDNWSADLMQAEIAFAKGDVDLAREKAKRLVNRVTNKYALDRMGRLL